MTTNTHETVAAPYRSEFSYLTDGQFDDLCVAADENFRGDADDEEAVLDSFGATLDDFASRWTEEEILRDILQLRK